MWTDPAHRGRGHARALLDALVGPAVAEGRPVALHVNVANPGARAFYEGYGFVGTGELEPLRPGSEQRIELMVIDASPRWLRESALGGCRETRQSRLACSTGFVTVARDPATSGQAARLTAEITAFSDAVTMLASRPTPHSTWSPTRHSTYAAAIASPPADRACSA